MKNDLATQNQCLSLIVIENKNIMAVTLPLNLNVYSLNYYAVSLHNGILH